MPQRGLVPRSPLAAWTPSFSSCFIAPFEASCDWPVSIPGPPTRIVKPSVRERKQLKNTPPGEVIEADPDEAIRLLDTLEELFDFYCVQPVKLEEKRDH